MSAAVVQRSWGREHPARGQRARVHALNSSECERPFLWRLRVWVAVSVQIPSPPHRCEGVTTPVQVADPTPPPSAVPCPSPMVLSTLGLV